MEVREIRGPGNTISRDDLSRFVLPVQYLRVLKLIRSTSYNEPIQYLRLRKDKKQ